MRRLWITHIASGSQQLQRDRDQKEALSSVERLTEATNKPTRIPTKRDPADGRFLPQGIDERV